MLQQPVENSLARKQLDQWHERDLSGLGVVSPKLHAAVRLLHLPTGYLQLQQNGGLFVNCLADAGIVCLHDDHDLYPQSGQHQQSNRCSFQQWLHIWIFIHIPLVKGSSLPLRAIVGNSVCQLLVLREEKRRRAHVHPAEAQVRKEQGVQNWA